MELEIWKLILDYISSLHAGTSPSTRWRWGLSLCHRSSREDKAECSVVIDTDQFGSVHINY